MCCAHTREKDIFPIWLVSSFETCLHQKADFNFLWGPQNTQLLSSPSLWLEVYFSVVVSALHHIYLHVVCFRSEAQNIQTSTRGKTNKQKIVQK